MIGEPMTERTERRQTLREMLSRLQDEARQRIKDLRRDQEPASKSRPACERSLASRTEEVETQAGLIAMAEDKLRYLDEAFARLDSGKYGRCLICSDLISIERLMAIPFASYCVDCQKQLNRERGGWGHAPYDHQWTVPKKMKTFDGTRSRTTVDHGKRTAPSG
jgi:DnaK suppressor protein